MKDTKSALIGMGYGFIAGAMLLNFVHRRYEAGLEASLAKLHQPPSSQQERTNNSFWNRTSKNGTNNMYYIFPKEKSITELAITWEGKPEFHTYKLLGMEGTMAVHLGCSDKDCSQRWHPGDGW